ncbi:MAG: sulfotransferase [Flavobacteriales bacterium]
MYDISPSSHKLIKNTILITGCQRSGTSLLGNLIGTASDVEYHYEPPLMETLLPSLCSAKNEEEKQKWALLFRAFCYEELAVSGLAGRRMNFNKGEKSYIGNMKDKKEIDSRLSGSMRRHELEDEVLNWKLGFKTPGVTHLLKPLKEIFPDIKTVIIYRNAKDTLQSLVKQKWFDDETPQTIWPCHVYKGSRIPECIPENDFDLWLNADTARRSAHYILRQWENTVDSSPTLLINYNELLSEPKKVAEHIFNKLNIKFSDKTKNILTTFKGPVNYSDTPEYDTLSDDIREKLVELERKLDRNATEAI